MHEAVTLRGWCSVRPGGRRRDTGSVAGVDAPAAPVRYRCTACGNLTRFDVVTDRRTRAFHHFSVGGALNVEEEQVLSEQVVEVSCRWCGHGRAVEVLEEAVSQPPEEAVSQSPEEAVSQPSATVAGKTSDGEPGDG